MLTIKCASCKSKIFKYHKIGKGQVLRCYKERIKRVYKAEIVDNQLKCSKCGNFLGKEIRNGSAIKMNQESFNYSGKKD